MVHITEEDDEILPPIDKLTEEILRHVPNELKPQLTRSLRKMYDDPPIRETEVLIQKNLTLDEIRKMIFKPSEDDLQKCYPLLISSPPKDSPENHPLRKTQIPFLGIFYLYHVKKWDRVTSFILGNGLKVLVNLMVDDNVFIRSQAIDSFMQITGPEGFDWFDPIPPPEKRNQREMQVRQKMYELLHSKMLNNLIANYWMTKDPSGKENFAGGSYYCLQILAFWLSWIRYFYTKDKKLSLSKDILNTLKEWSERSDLPKEETDLAKRLYDDFSREPPLEEKEQMEKQRQLQQQQPEQEQPQPQPQQPEQKKEEKIEQQKPSTRLEKEPEKAIDEEFLRAEQFKNEGNEHFKRGEYDAAIEAYTKAIRACGERVNPAYFTNRAIAYLKRSSLASGPDSTSMKRKDFTHALLDCDRAIQLEPHSAKAYFRKAQAYEGLSQFQDALEAVQLALKYSKDKAIVELSEQIKKKLAVAEEKARQRQQQQEQRQRAATSSFSPYDLSAMSDLLASSMEAHKQREAQQQQQQQQKEIPAPSIEIRTTAPLEEDDEAVQRQQEQPDPIQVFLSRNDQKNKKSQQQGNNTNNKPLIQEL